MRRVVALCALAGAALAASGCAVHDDGAAAGGATAGGGGAAGGELLVLAAASLNVVLEDVGEVFAAQHPGARVTFSFAGSSDLVAQLSAGAPADVLLTADEGTMADAVEAGTVVGEPQVVAENVLTLVTPAGNPAGVTGLDDSLDGAHLVVCAPQVPCGAATAALAERLDVTLRPVSEEGSVTSVLGKVTSGQADAGLVYATDARAAGDRVEVVPVPGADSVVNRYPAAVAADAEEPGLARAWVELLRGPEAQRVLTDAGFGVP